MSDTALTKQDALTLFGRLLAFYLTVWALVDFTYIPERIFSLMHYIARVQDSAIKDPYYLHMIAAERLSIGLGILRILLLITAAASVWSAGPWLQRLILPTPADTTHNTADN